MKDSGIEWIGEIPKEWNVSRIKYTASNKEKSFIDGDWIESPYITDKGIRLIQTGNIGIGKYVEKDNRFISEETFEELNCNEVFPGDILICRLASPVGRACLAPKLKERMITSVDVAILRPKEIIDSKYIVYSLSSHSYLEFMELISRGATRLRVSRTLLGETHLPLPNLEEQQRIANFLDDKTSKIDSLIATKEKQMELLNEYKQSLISETVTKGLNPNVKTKNSGVEWIGEIPEHWNLTALKYLGRIFNGNSMNETEKEKRFSNVPEGYNYIGTKDLDLMNQNINYNTGIKIPYENKEFKVARKGCPIICSEGGSAGKKIGYLKEDVCFGNKLYAFEANNKVISKFVYYFYLSKYFQDLFSSNLTGLIPGISINQFIQFKVTHPPIVEQQKIVEFLDHKISQIDSLINNIQNEIDKLKKYKESLIFEAVTGKIIINS